MRHGDLHTLSGLVRFSRTQMPALVRKLTMKSTLSLFALVALIASAHADARPPSPSPLLGRWTVDLAKLPIPPEARPKSVIFAFTPVPGGQWRTTVDIVDADGSERHMASTAALDGAPTKIEGNMSEADTVALSLPQPNVLVMSLARGGAPASTRVYTIAPRGKVMTETATYVGEDGKPLFRINKFIRAK